MTPLHLNEVFSLCPPSNAIPCSHALWLYQWSTFPWGSVRSLVHPCAGRVCRHVYCGIKGQAGCWCGGLSRGRLQGQLRERGSHGKGPPKAWNASEVSRGWSGGDQRSSPGMEQVLLCRPSGIKDVTGLKRLVLALQSGSPLFFFSPWLHG